MTRDSTKCDNCPDAEQAFDPLSLPAALDRTEMYELALYQDTDGIQAASFTQAMRDRAAKKGQAMSDGSFPIRNRSDLRNAIQAIGRAKDQAAARRHIIKRARALKAISALPAAWGITAAGTFTEAKHPRHPKGDPKGGEFAPKGTSKLAPRPDEVTDVTRGGKLVRGPGGKLMSKTEAGVLLDKREGRYVKSHSTTEAAKPFQRLTPTGELAPELPPPATRERNASNEKYAAQQVAQAQTDIAADYEAIGYALSQDDLDGVRSAAERIVQRMHDMRLFRQQA